MGHKLDNVIGLYVHGVWDGHLDAAIDKFVRADPAGTRAAGSIGRRFSRAFEPLVARYERRFVQPVRGFEDGGRVVLHTFQSFGYQTVQQVSIDIFDTDDDDMIVGWWNATSPLAPVNARGHSQIDGPTMVEDLGATATNKRVVQAYLDGLDDGCVCPTEFAQHSSSSSAAVAAGPTSVLQVAGCGNFVAVYRHRRPARVGGNGEAVCDLYRLDHGHIVEHWDTAQAMA
jgi:predicted SnoaL-like aldol condensation-catalyzing enzyme